jgi:hypothetical protein
MEEWREVPNFSRYRVSTAGLVKTLRYKRGTAERLLKPQTDADGYLWVGLLDDTGKRCNVRVARLVATAFLPNPDTKPEVDHLNRIITDNRVENLRWATRQEQNNNRGAFSNTGERNISKVVVETYYVHRIGHKTRRFKTLDEAIAYRDSIIPVLAEAS